MNYFSLHNITKRFRNAHSDVLSGISLELKKGEILALLGKSGCGKTTLLRAIAGLEELNDGEFVLNNTTLNSSKVFIQPEKRRIGLVFQDYALFPHLTALENISFGLGALPKKERAVKAQLYLEKVGLQNMGNYYPHELSGGQQQRLALARTLATEPLLLLLDEPFSNLDDTLKKEMRMVVRDIIDSFGITTIVVTHDANDAFALADRVAVMQDGQLIQVGTSLDIYKYPKSEYVARLTGSVNVLNAVAVESNRVQIENSIIQIEPQKLVINQRYKLVIRPENVQLSSKGSVDAVVKAVSFLGAYYEILVAVGNCRLLVHTKDSRFLVGEKVKLEFLEIFICE
ncbi:MAG: ABC transporter ATP-binding protein [Bacteroidetes bacterium]|nr:ABC transporter ATP-binding protein [Bacteroidota bacterium]